MPIASNTPGYMTTPTSAAAAAPPGRTRSRRCFTTPGLADVADHRAFTSKPAAAAVADTRRDEALSGIASDPPGSVVHPR